MTVANIVTEFAEKGLVIEQVETIGVSGNTNVGRPSFRVYTVPYAVIVLCIYISEMEITCSLVNLNCEQIVSRTIIPTQKEDNRLLLKKIDNVIHPLLAEASNYASRIRGIGISSVGLVDSDSRRIIGADNYPNIHELPIAEYFEDKYGIPALLSNDMKASAIAERHYGKMIDTENFIYMGVNSSIGLGIYINDEIYRGFNGFSGELGYTTIDFRGKSPTFGHGRRLESYIRIDQYVRRVNRDVTKKISGLPAFASSPVTWKDIVREALAGNAYCDRILREIGDFLVIATEHVLNIFDPETVILGGQIALAGDMIVDYIRNQLQGQSLASYFYTSTNHPEKAQVPIELSSFIDKSGVIGAGAVFFDSVFKGNIHFLI